MSREKIEIIVKDFPADLKKRLAAAAEREESSVNDVAVRILCDEFRVPWEPVGRALLRRDASGELVRATVDGPNLSLTVPFQLRTKMKMQAAKVNGTLTGIVIATLARHFGLGAISPAKRRRRARV